MKWLKGSRFWSITPWFVVLAAFLAWHFEDPSVFVNVTVPWMAGAGAKTTVDTWKNPGAPT